MGAVTIAYWALTPTFGLGGERTAIVLTAAELAAPSLRAERPTERKWWLKGGIEGVPGNAYAIADPGNVDVKTWNNLPGTLSPEAILTLARHDRDKGVSRFGLYESTEFCWQPEARKAIREAGRLFAAR